MCDPGSSPTSTTARPGGREAAASASTRGLKSRRIRSRTRFPSRIVGINLNDSEGARHPDSLRNSTCYGEDGWCPLRVILSSLASSLASVVWCSLALYGQEATFRSDTRLVVLNVSVMDQEGKVVKNLPKTAFSIYENGEKQAVSVFRQEDVPISLGLIIDTSASMTD